MTLDELLDFAAERGENITQDDVDFIRREIPALTLEEALDDRIGWLWEMIGNTINHPNYQGDAVMPDDDIDD